LYQVAHALGVSIAERIAVVPDMGWFMSRWRRSLRAVERAGAAAPPARRLRFESVFAEVYEPLQRYVGRRTDPATAQDVVAEALLVVWRRLDDVPTDDALPWCYGVARRCLANARRSERRRDALVDRLMAQRPADEPDGDTALEGALAHLSADDRELLHLWAWEQLQPREIATVLGISANAASIRLHRAKQRLGDVLGGSRKNDDPSGQEVVGHTEEAR
jgi:RNA polymerase sigma-70 factor (ECF subfamily)